MSAPPDEPSRAELRELAIELVVPNDQNPRLDFPQGELEKLTDSIDQEGILVPIVVFERGDKFVLVDGERRFRCARDLNLAVVPALITSERPERDVLLQMFNIHLIREPWRDLPTALALARLAEAVQEESGTEPDDRELATLTGLSVDRVRQLRYIVSLPQEWQDYIRQGTIPLNYFWELKKNVLDQLARRRPSLLAELGADNVQRAFVDKRLNSVITDTVSLRKVAPIIQFAEQDESERGDEAGSIDDALRQLVSQPDATIEDAYEDTVQMMVEVTKLGRRTDSMVTAFRRLLRQAESNDERESILELGNRFVTDLSGLLSGYGSGGSAN